MPFWWGAMLSQSFVPDGKGSLVRLMSRGRVTWPTPACVHWLQMILGLPNSWNCPWGIWVKRTGKETQTFIIVFPGSWQRFSPTEPSLHLGGFTSSSHCFMCDLNYFCLQLPDSYVSQLNDGQESQVIQIEGTVFIFTLKACNKNRKSLFWKIM